MAPFGSQTPGTYISIVGFDVVMKSASIYLCLRTFLFPFGDSAQHEVDDFKESVRPIASSISDRQLP